MPADSDVRADGLAPGASLIGKYPYCGLRVLAFMTPGFCLLAGAGVQPVAAWARRRQPRMIVFLWIALAIPFLYTARRLVDHWPRANIQDSSEYVLANWQDGDMVGFNHWEGEYYFRNIADHWYDAPSCVPACSKESPTRIWYLACSSKDVERETCLKRIPPGWRIIERREFKFAIVALFVHDANGLSSTSSAGLVR